MVSESSARNTQTTIQYTLEISFQNRQGSRLLPKTRSLSCILWGFQDYFSLLGWTSPTGDKQASSSPESIHIQKWDHGFEMRNTNLLKSSNSKLESWRKDWDFSHLHREYVLDLKCFKQDSEIIITSSMI